MFAAFSVFFFFYLHILLKHDAEERLWPVLIASNLHPAAPVHLRLSGLDERELGRRKRPPRSRDVRHLKGYLGNSHVQWI